MQGMREYLPEQNIAPLHNAILKVQEQHQSEPNFSDSLTLALYKFQVSSSIYSSYCCTRYISKVFTMHFPKSLVGQLHMSNTTCII